MSDYLCEELIVEILTRLPPKSLLRFRSLSKSLCSCISSPGFIRKHTSRTPRKIIFSHVNRKKTNLFYTLHGEEELSLCLSPKRGYIGIKKTVPLYPCSTTSKRGVGSCNGIFCIRTNRDLSLWNPAIRRKLSLPECPQRFELPPGGIGFGFDQINDDYKVVWISYTKDSSFVYAVKTGTWCEITSPKPQLSHVSYEAFLFNGVLHWEVHDFDIRLTDRYPPPYILTFDLSTHVFGRIPLPGPTCEWRTTNITTIQGFLALIAYRMKADDTWIRVWKDASWTVVFKLGTGTLPIRGALQLQPQPTNNGDLLLITYEEGIQNYNSKTGVRSRVANFYAASSLRWWRSCVETLQLLDMRETPCETMQL